MEHALKSSCVYECVQKIPPCALQLLYFKFKPQRQITEKVAKEMDQT